MKTEAIREDTVGNANEDAKATGAGKAPQAPPAHKGGLKPSHIAWIVALVLVAVAITQNHDKTRLSFLWMDGEIGLWLLVVICVALGFVLGYGGHVFYARGHDKDEEADEGKDKKD